MNELFRKRQFVLLLTSQGILNFGDSFRFIAITLMLFKLTGSGVSTAAGLIFSALPSIIFSPFAGTLGDFIKGKYLMALVDLIRSFVIILFISIENPTGIYFLLVLLSILDLFYSPARRKMIVNICGRNGVLKANSIFTGVSGVSFLLGPLLAGMLTDSFGPDPSIIISSLSALVSSILILFIKFRFEAASAKQKTPLYGNRFLSETVKGFSYFRTNTQIRQIVITGLVSSLCLISVNMAFYPFSFDILGLTAKGWSFMISIYYGTNLFAMLLMGIFNTKSEAAMWKIIFTGFAMTAVIWMCYGFTQKLGIIFALQFIEGTILSVCGIFLATLLQITAPKGFVARISGINDIASNAGKIAGLVFTFLIMMLESCRSVFFFCSIVLLVFSLTLLFRIKKKM